MKHVKLHIYSCHLFLALSILGYGNANSQQVENQYRISSPFHNQLFFNRFLINPTYSLVRENKSYLNVLMRNQASTFQDNNQNYFLGFSNKLNENTAMGIGIYGNWSGVVQEFGFNANYATAVQLGEKSALSFGANIGYVSQGLDQNRIVINENDPVIEDVQKENIISIAPGINLSLGNFDFGIHLDDVVRYNQTTEELLTSLNETGIKTTFQYSHKFKNSYGLFEGGRLMPLVQLGLDENKFLEYTGSLLMELPKFGWLQTTYDTNFGFSSGIGFNLSKKLSLGYLMEKNTSDSNANLGWNHELSLGYSFNDDLRGIGVDVNIASSEDARVDQIVRNYEEQILALKEEMKKTSILPTDKESLAYENRLVLDELMLRQDSIERARDKMLERRFETMVRLLRHEIRAEQKALPKERVANRYNQTGIAMDTRTSKVKDNADGRFKEIRFKGQAASAAIGVKSGYYMIANVFKNKNYLNAFLADLEDRGVKGQHFYNKENGLYYVYLADFKTKDDASLAYVNNLNGNYKDEKWIMEVYNPMATADISFEN